MPNTDVNGILTFNQTGRYATWAPDSRGPRGLLAGMTEGFVPEDQLENGRLLASGHCYEQWAVLVKLPHDAKKLGVYPETVPPRWEGLSEESAGVDASTAAAVPAKTTLDKTYWSATPSEMVKMTIATLDQYEGTNCVQAEELLFFGAETQFEVVSTIPGSLTEHMPGGVPSKAVFTALEDRRGEVGWLYREHPVMNQGAVSRLVIHFFAHPDAPLPKLGELLACTKHSSQNSDLRDTFSRALKHQPFQKQGEIRWYKSVVSVARGDLVEP
jgi:hypothetical protein